MMFVSPFPMTLCMAIGLAMPTLSHSQARTGCHSSTETPPQQPLASATQDRRFSSAYGRFVKLADGGDAAAASAALFMLRNGKQLFGSEWSATEAQQAHWNALAINAARYQSTPITNGADD